MPANVLAYSKEEKIEYHHFDTPIDALSVEFPSSNSIAEVRGWDGKRWTVWEKFTIEDTADSLPGSRESQLILFPTPIHGVEIRSMKDVLLTLHPLQISSDISHEFFAASNTRGSKIISRSGWGADSEILFANTMKESSPQASEERKGGGAGGTTSDSRAETCADDRRKYPKEFDIAQTVRTNDQGKAYRWSLQYSHAVRMLVVHHTALTVLGDARSGVERMRALYQYHASNLGWGDTGYHYVIDERGNIYEGKHGGAFVVGGHAYCNNVGTIGIALMGNFEVEEPSQDQVKALQWLSRELSQQYNIDLNRGVVFHGREYASPIVGHENLLSTLCPGYFLKSVLPQVVVHARTGDINAAVKFPTIPGRKKLTNPNDLLSEQGTLTAFGRTSFTMNPGGKQRISLTYRAGKYGTRVGTVIADAIFSTSDISLFLEDANRLVPIRNQVKMNIDVPALEEATISLILQAPPEQGTFTFSLGSVRYTITAVGRRSRLYDPDLQQSSLPSSKNSSSARSQTLSPNIRVRLSLKSSSPSITFPAGGTINALPVARGTTVDILQTNDGCSVQSNGRTLIKGSPLRFTSFSGDFSVLLGSNLMRYYDGVLECRVMNSGLTLINELSLEQYMLGLGEEPDTEHKEKQKAFAIAARTYAAHYLDAQHRKFPNMPFDASDDPREFQVYIGKAFSQKNPVWAQVVRETVGQVLTYRGAIIKPPYFHSSDGRTRSPKEAGWNNFPFAEIFTSKQDPWCKGSPLSGHGVGMSGCGALGQARVGKTAEEILQYYYPGTQITKM